MWRKAKELDRRSGKTSLSHKRGRFRESNGCEETPMASALINNSTGTPGRQWRLQITGRGAFGSGSPFPKTAVQGSRGASKLRPLGGVTRTRGDVMHARFF